MANRRRNGCRVCLACRRRHRSQGTGRGNRSRDGQKQICGDPPGIAWRRYNPVISEKTMNRSAVMSFELRVAQASRPCPRSKGHSRDGFATRHSMLRAWLAPLILLHLAGAIALTAVEPPPSLADVRKEFADGKYRDVMKSVTKITVTREWQAKKTDGYELMTMKAESHFRLKENTLAASAFDAAAKMAPDAQS